MAYLESLRHFTMQVIFPAVYLIFTATKLYHQVFSENIPLCIYNSGGHETLNLLNASSCKIFHFVISYMNQNKNCKETLRSMQYRLAQIVHKAQIEICAIH